MIPEVMVVSLPSDLYTAVHTAVDPLSTYPTAPPHSRNVLWSRSSASRVTPAYPPPIPQQYHRTGLKLHTYVLQSAHAVELSDGRRGARCPMTNYIALGCFERTFSGLAVLLPANEARK